MPGKVAIDVQRVSKSFRLPLRRVDTLRERVAAGLRPESEELRVLEDVSFTVPRGEFFGIVGRNGSGKSTLLKIMAGIYRPDAGEILAAGKLAPIIELGVGFNAELPAYDNVVMNGVMMGLKPEAAEDRYGEILEFSELGRYEHLPLKNYSSGMRARLGFSIMVHVDADILLFDEVLAVGDAGFHEKCAATFAELRRSGRTGVLVTHSMGSLVEHCDQAMLLERGRVQAIGDPMEVAGEYTRLKGSGDIGAEASDDVGGTTVRSRRSEQTGAGTGGAMSRPIAPTRRKPLSERVRDWITSLNPAWFVFVFAAFLSIAFVGLQARGALLAGDEWDYFHRLATQPFHQAIFDAPPDKYLLAVPLLTVYAPLAEIFGIGEYLPYRLTGIGLVVIAAALLTELVRRRAGFRFALPAGILLLFLGAAGEVTAGPQRIPSLMATCFGLAMLLALDREDRRGDVAAGVLGFLGIASHPIMLPFLAGAGVRIVFGRQPRVKRALTALGPAALVFVLWRTLVYEQRPAVFPQTFEGVVDFAAEHYVAWVATVSGLFRGPFVTDGDFVNGLSVALAILFALLLVAAIVRRRGITLGLAAALMITAVALVAPALGPAGALRTPTEARYLHPGAIILLILMAELVAAWQPSPRPVRYLAFAAGAIWLLSAIPLNVAELDKSADSAAQAGYITRAELAGLERAEDDPESLAAIAESAGGDEGSITSIAFGGGQFGETSAERTAEGAAAYFDVARTFGTPAWSVEALEATPNNLRTQADLVLIPSIPIDADPLEEAPLGLEQEAKDAKPLGDAELADGTCAVVRSDPGSLPSDTPAAPEGAAPPLALLELPPGEVWIDDKGASTLSLRVGRFGDTPIRFVDLPAGFGSSISLPEAGAPDAPWRFLLYSDAKLTVCVT